MKNIILISNFIIFFYCFSYGQTKAELEDQRRKTLEEISYVDNILKNTTKEKNESIGTLKILGNKLNLRESVINGMGSEISLLSSRIEINRLAIEMMEDDLKTLKEDYSKTIINSYKSKKINPDVVYIISAKDFNQGYKRLKYLQQVTKIRRNESEIINELKEEIENAKMRLEEDLMKISDLRQREIIQKNLLKEEQTKKQRMLKSLGNKEKQLQKDLYEKRKIARKLENEIARIIEEERKRNLNTELTPEQRIISENFSDNKGRLPWPVERGSITSHFGSHQHPVLKYVTEQNFGIEITSVGRTMARSVFKGEVSAIFAISGANMTVIIRHGKYLSVYSNLINVKVKNGEKIETKQEIGEVFADPGANNNCTLKLMIYEQKNALDPETWITKI
jgi:septal ring factor EnvC (AmiA/AmiB activator)